MQTFLTTIALMALLTPSFGTVLMCYYGSWSGERPGNGKFTVEDIDSTLCTHIMYAFVGLDPYGNVVAPDEDSYKSVVALKTNATKIIASMGGWSEGSLNFTAVVTNATIRSTFVSNIVIFLDKYGFDGLDVDWEYPAQRGGAATDVENYVLLLKELKEAFEDGGYLLTAAVPAVESTAEPSYDIPNITKYLDYINLMTYDIHGSWDSTIGINAPLYPASYETTASELELNVNASVTFWINAGADPSKLVLGMPSYAKTYTLADVNNNTPGSNFTGKGKAGPYTDEEGTLGYNELCEMQLSGNWTIVWFEEQQVPYSYSGDQWAGYDNVKSVGVKTNFAIAHGLAGVMFWALDLDDFKPVCSDVKFPLMRTAHDILFGNSSES